MRQLPKILATVLAAALALPVAGTAGCGAVPPAASSSAEELSEAIRSFNDGVRWERFTVAVVAIPPPQRSEFLDAMDERANDVKISDYDIVRVDPQGKREARVQIKLSWYKNSDGTVHETHALQTWEQRGKTWWMVDEIRLRGAEMPGLSESSKSESGTPAASATHASANGAPECGESRTCNRPPASAERPEQAARADR